MSQGISPEIAGFFQDPDASSAVVLAAQQIAAPVVQGAPMTPKELEMGGGVRVVYLILDASPSMEPVARLLREGFNTDYVPAVQEAREDDISALRIGGAAFSRSPSTRLWKGANGDYFHTIDNLPQLTSSDYDPNRGWGTELHQAILDGTATAVRYASEVGAEISIDPEIDIIVLSDGADNSHVPASEVKQVVSARDKTRMRFMFLYFETELGLSVKRPAAGRLSELERYVVRDLGFDGEQVMAFAAKPGETREERAHRFRQMMRVLSKVSASRGTSVVVATAAVLEDDELV